MEGFDSDETLFRVSLCAADVQTQGERSTGMTQITF